jgi:putative membrane protein
MQYPLWKKNDRKANLLIILFSVVVFLAVTALKYIEVNIELGFDIHIFAKINAFLNGTVAVILVVALWAIKSGQILLHRKLMLAAMGLSVLFLVSYILHHLLAGDTKYPADAPFRGLYFFILITHIFLAAIILPFILFTAYRALTGEIARHKKIARITWPIWFYVAVTGVLVYLMIHPYY